MLRATLQLASDSPATLCEERVVDTLEQAFIAHLEDADAGSTPTADDPGDTPPVAWQAAAPSRPSPPKSFSLLRLFGYARRETLELLRDPIRLIFALLGSVILMFILGYGINMDVEDLSFAVLDLDRSPQSRDYIQNIAGSRYFIQRSDIATPDELERRLRSGELSLAIEIPPGFGRQLKRDRRPEVGVWIDGAMPFRAETIRGYLQGMHYAYLNDLSLRTYGIVPGTVPADIESRYRYNQDFKSLEAMVPAVIPLLLVFIPAILMALGVVREKELGSITNLYVTPVTRLEFLLGKQLPYLLVSMVSYAGLVALAVYVFGVPLKGSLAALTLAAFFYVTATTGLGLLMSAFTKTQIAALAGTSVLTLMIAVNFCGLTHPAASLEGPGALIGRLFPTTYFLDVSRGAFTKALGFSDLAPQLLPLAAFIPVLTLASVLALRKQDR